ncbi:MAG: LacI family transcriptional regulator, partial [Anaeroplasmataceae bacterium]|nr:LacI family transcriptional regulator [Anaeroplasmataceae bacterium]
YIECSKDVKTLKRKTSIYDIAKCINVSPTTVSYVINNKGKVSWETRQKVLKAIEELGFVPDTTARSLSTGKSHLIGLFLPLDNAAVAFTQNPFYVEFLTGLEIGIADYDYDIVIGCQKNINNFGEWVRSRGLDGVIMIGRYPQKTYQIIDKLNIPIVLIDVYEEYPEKFYNIRVDDKKGMYDATKYLISKGHTKIGFIGAPKRNLIDYNRYKGYELAMIEANLAIEEDYLFDEFSTFDSGLKVGEKLIEQRNVSAVVCCADIIAIGIIRKFNERNLKIPDELSIVGFDDIQDAKFIYPGLTTIRQDIRQKGELASRTIMQHINHQTTNESLISLDLSLVERESVKENI